MNICIFAKGLPTHIIGGGELHTHELTRGLVERGHKVTIITTKHPKGIKEEKKGNVKIYYVGNEPLKYNKKFCIESAKLFDKLDKQENFDIVHSQQYFGAGFAKYSKSKKPFVVTMHSTLKNEIRSILNGRSMRIFYIVPFIYLKSFFFYNYMDKFLFRRAKKIIAVSNELKEDVVKEYKISENKLVVIPSSIDINKFKPINVDKFRKKLGISKNEKVIVSSGRIEKQKGYHLVIEVLPSLLKHVNIKLVIIGTGGHLENLKRFAERNKVSDNMIFTGKISDEDMLKYYNLADVFVFPTMRLEGLPLVVLEAMACEKPVITTRIGGIPTAIKNNVNGILIPLGNLKELETKILEILNNQYFSKKIAKNARKSILENFNLDRMVEETIKIYKYIQRDDTHPN